jgi:hypothetical protein
VTHASLVARAKDIARVMASESSRRFAKSSRLPSMDEQEHTSMDWQGEERRRRQDRERRKPGG